MLYKPPPRAQGGILYHASRSRASDRRLAAQATPPLLQADACPTSNSMSMLLYLI
ncbi:unnamed protein product, partial [Cylicocyclus nassatus]